MIFLSIFEFGQHFKKNHIIILYTCSCFRQFQIYNLTGYNIVLSFRSRTSMTIYVLSKSKLSFAIVSIIQLSQRYLLLESIF